MTFSDMEIKELRRSTQINIHNTRSSIRTSEVCLRHLAVGESLHGGRIYTQTYTHTHTNTHRHTHTHTHTRTHTHTQSQSKQVSKFGWMLITISTYAKGKLILKCVGGRIFDISDISVSVLNA